MTTTYPTLDPGIADTLVRVLAAGLCADEVIGVRGERDKVPSGHSWVWVDGDRTDEELDGLSAIELAYDTASGPVVHERTCLVERSYCAGIGRADPRDYGNRVFLLRGARLGPGEDNEEVVIGDAEVIAEVRL